VKTRIFTMAPVDMTLAIRALTMHFSAWFYGNNCKDYSAVGVNAHGPAWTEIYQAMKKKALSGIDGDYGMYDGTLDPDCIQAAMDLITAWTFRPIEIHRSDGTQEWQKPEAYTIVLSDGEEIQFTEEQFAVAMRICSAEFVHTTQIVMNVIHRKTQGNPSGNPLTVILNTMVGYMYMALAYLEAGLKTGRGIKSFADDVACIIYGDDNIVAWILEEFEEWNPAFITAFFADHGIEYTTADKSGAEQEMKPVEKLRFLKRGFRPHPVYPNFIRAPIDMDTIYEMTNWMRECPDEKEQLYCQIDTALREAAAHGGEFYRLFLGQVNQALMKVKYEQVPDEYDMLDEEWLAQFR